jgi:hypothetical protein
MIILLVLVQLFYLPLSQQARIRLDSAGSVPEGHKGTPATAVTRDQWLVVQEPNSLHYGWEHRHDSGGTRRLVLIVQRWRRLAPHPRF